MLLLYNFHISFNMLLISDSHILPLNVPFLVMLHLLSLAGIPLFISSLKHAQVGDIS